MKNDPQIAALELWAQLRNLFMNRDNDVFQHSMGNVVAGVRVRKALREMKKLLPKIIRVSADIDRTRRKARKLVNKQKKSLLKE